MDPQSIVLREVTVIYPALFKPKVPKGSGPDTVPKFSVTVLLPPTYDTTELNRIALAAAQASFGSNAAQLIQAGAIKSPFRSQLEKHAQGKSGYSDNPAAKYINCASERQPGVVDQSLQPILDPSKIYGGVICNVQISAFAWNHPTGGKGISFSLQNVQFVKDGPRLGSENPDPKSVFQPLAMPVEGKQADDAVRAIFG